MHQTRLLRPQAPRLDDDEDEFDIDRDERSRGLLSSTHGPSYSARYLEPVSRIWPQVKSIAIEVRVMLLAAGTGPFIFALLECPDTFDVNYQSLIHRKTVGPGLGAHIASLKHRKNTNDASALASNARSRPTHNDNTRGPKSTRKPQDESIRAARHSSQHRRTRRPIRPSFHDHWQPLTIAGASYIRILHRIMHGSHSWKIRTAKLPCPSRALLRLKTQRRQFETSTTTNTTIHFRHAITLPPPETVWKSGFLRSYSLFHFSRV